MNEIMKYGNINMDIVYYEHKYAMNILRQLNQNDPFREICHRQRPPTFWIISLLPGMISL